MMDERYMDKFTRFKNELQNLIYKSIYDLNKKSYSFESQEYPDVDAILMLSRFFTKDKYELLMEKVYERLRLEKMPIYLEKVSSYYQEPNEDSYKAIGEIIIPITEQVLEEMNTNDLTADANSKCLETKRIKSRSHSRWNWR
ncbi:hypothetical protein [Enterococcus rivorum]|uniref:Uncharacterized protein n=1 Tax=Enterococcus rivorum TaxID=762845 RepID=A0A1E5L0E0_9ENTE|nr:hypothetical protein [Enterococcus rivorum]MBP2098861.1 hypothetical protein [Enterococcus rivorum]OEH83590.1 hypothetical protein BCR26_08920 [Enterococcus rivorum]